MGQEDNRRNFLYLRRSRQESAYHFALKLVLSLLVFRYESRVSIPILPLIEWAMTRYLFRSSLSVPTSVRGRPLIVSRMIGGGSTALPCFTMKTPDSVRAVCCRTLSQDSISGLLRRSSYVPFHCPTQTIIMVVKC